VAGHQNKTTKEIKKLQDGECLEKLLMRPEEEDDLMEVLLENYIKGKDVMGKECVCREKLEGIFGKHPISLRSMNDEGFIVRDVNLH
jgi:hypothetical protein